MRIPNEQPVVIPWIPLSLQGTVTVFKWDISKDNLSYILLYSSTLVKLQTLKQRPNHIWYSVLQNC